MDHQLIRREFEQSLRVGDWQGRVGDRVSVHGVAKRQTRQSDRTELKPAADFLA